MTKVQLLVQNSKIKRVFTKFCLIIVSTIQNGEEFCIRMYFSLYFFHAKSGTTNEQSSDWIKCYIIIKLIQS